MAKEMWYWEYQLKIWDEIDCKEEIRSGVIVADTFTKAMQEIENYYGDEIILEVQTLKAITDGVFEFQHVMENTDFNYVINRKM